MKFNISMSVLFVRIVHSFSLRGFGGIGRRAQCQSWFSGNLYTSNV